MIRPLTLARLLSVVLPVVAAACSSEPGPSEPLSGAASLKISGLPNSVLAGAPADVVVTAEDASGNIATGYTGTVHFTSTDPAAELPPNYTFLGADRGSHTVTVTFGTAGNQTVTATDAATSSINGDETVTVVTPAPNAGDVFAVGSDGTILQYDGNRWTAPARVTRSDLFGVWGTSGSDVFAVGDNGTILHYDGTSWTAQASGTTDGIHGVWGTSGHDVFAVGDYGTILHYDGTSWTQQMRDAALFFKGVWGSSGSDVFAVADANAPLFGFGSRILHYDGTSWTTQRIDSTISHSGVWGTSGHDVFAVGDSILHYDGTSWTGQGYWFLSGVWGSSGIDVFAVGDGLILHYDGAIWATMQCPCREDGQLDGVWGSVGSDVFAVGINGSILHYDGSRWTTQTIGLTPNFTGTLWAVWGSSRRQ